MTRLLGRIPPRAQLPLCVAGLAGLLQMTLAPPVELIAPGLANGSLYGLTAVGLLLIYRNNRIVNFAAAGLGAVPGVLAALLTSGHGLPFFVALLLALGGGAVLGGASDVLVIRRFSKAPRLILTVVTLGLVQVLAFFAIYVPIWLGGSAHQSSTVSTPFDSLSLTFHDRTVLRGQQVFAVALVALLTLGLSVGLRRTRVGVGLRAAAENPDRAALLGVPVQLIGTIAWSVAGLFAGVTIFLRATLIGIPYDGSLGYSVLLYALAAAVVARMENVGVALLAGMGIGVLEQASVARTGSPDLTSAIMLLVILTALLFQRGTSSRAADAAISSLGIAGKFRPIPPELRSLPEVRAARFVLSAVVLGVAVAAPFVAGEGGIGSLTLLPIFGMVAVSLVVLTGWAGQISLGHMALVGVGAAVSGGIAADYDVDFFVALFVGALAGALAALLIGLPAVRVQGLYLAVTTLSFAGAAQYWLLKKGYPVADAILPSGADPRVRRPVLWQRIDLADDRTFYGLCCVLLVVVTLLAASFRRSRSGRVFLAVRDNARAAPAYAVDVTRTRLVAFALSGAIAAAAGVLLIYQQKVFDADTYGIAPSVEIFVAAVIGGLSSLPGAVLGAVLVFGVKYFGEKYVPHASLLVTGPGLLLVLYVFPGGLSQLLFGLRDRALRVVATRRGLLAPSLLTQRLEPVAADGPDPDPAAPRELQEVVL
jgi:branched-chain amino acid transport system permease protein